MRRASEWYDMVAKPADGWVNVRVTGVGETEGATLRKVIGSPGGLGVFLEVTATPAEGLADPVRNAGGCHGGWTLRVRRQRR